MSACGARQPRSWSARQRTIGTSVAVRPNRERRTARQADRSRPWRFRQLRGHETGRESRLMHRVRAYTPPAVGKSPETEDARRAPAAAVPAHPCRQRPSAPVKAGISRIARLSSASVSRVEEPRFEPASGSRSKLKCVPPPLYPRVLRPSCSRRRARRTSSTTERACAPSRSCERRRSVSQTSGSVRAPAQSDLGQPDIAPAEPRLESRASHSERQRACRCSPTRPGADEHDLARVRAHAAGGPARQTRNACRDSVPLRQDVNRRSLCRLRAVRSPYP